MKCPSHAKNVALKFGPFGFSTDVVLGTPASDLHS